MITSFEFQQTEVYQLTNWAKDEDNTYLKSSGVFLTEIAQQGAGPATSGNWTGVFHLSTEQVLCFQLQCRPAHSTLPACLPPDLEGPAKGENMIRSPCPSHACLVSWDWPCMIRMVLGFGDLMGKLSMHGGKPRLTGNPSIQHSLPQSIMPWDCKDKSLGNVSPNPCQLSTHLPSILVNSKT